MPFDPPFWNWLILTGIFLLAEVLTVSFFFLFWGLAAAALVVITLAVPTLDWRTKTTPRRYSTTAAHNTSGASSPSTPPSKTATAN